MAARRSPPAKETALAAPCPRQGIATRKDGGLRFAVIADTHSAPHPDAIDRVAKEVPDHVLHAGDIGDLAVLDRFAKVAPVTAVRGNIDEHALEIPEARIIDIVRDGSIILSFLLTHIAVFGPRLRADVFRTALAADVGLVVCGHSHVPFIGRDRGIAVFNPGSCGPKRFQLPILFGVLEIGTEGVALKHVDCLTGARWRP